jgi:two-component system, LytTR family, response regulator
VRVLIVEDERPARVRLRRLLGAEPDIEIIGEADNGDAAIAAVIELRPDLLFLDVELPGPDGLAVLAEIPREALPCTIFITAHSEHAVHAFGMQAIDYLLKPYSRERLAEAIQRARRQLARAPSHPEAGAQRTLSRQSDGQRIERFLVKNHRRYLVVRSDQIISAESAANYVVLRTAQGNQVLRRTLNQLERELDPARFFRTSRSALVSLDHVREIKVDETNAHRVVLTDGKELVLTRSLRELQERLQSPRER